MPSAREAVQPIVFAHRSCIQPDFSLKPAASRLSDPASCGGTEVGEELLDSPREIKFMAVKQSRGGIIVIACGETATKFAILPTSIGGDFAEFRENGCVFERIENEWGAEIAERQAYTTPPRPSAVDLHQRHQRDRFTGTLKTQIMRLVPIGPGQNARPVGGMKNSGIGMVSAEHVPPFVRQRINGSRY